MRCLVAVDGSSESETALAFATDIADATDGAITVVHAVDPTVYEEGGTEPISSLSDADQRLIIESVEEAEQRGLDLLDEAAAFADELGHSVETELLYGDPVAEISGYAESQEFDIIFVGHHGLSQQTERVLGSIAKSLVERATVPVTVVR